MATFKLHIYKKLSNGTLIANTACGRGTYTKNGAPNVMYKTNAFKMAYNAGEAVCLTCLAKAKEQGRI
tara:strand:- start:253 stop:456 length:204 start_codon:yes stop_codon:yes gene_type:complete